jgi:hypothetical protein
LIHSENTDCILSQSSESKLIRNKISHLNLFYDKKTKKIVILGGKHYTKRQFMKQYKQLFMMMFCWIKESTPNNPKGQNFKQDIEKEISQLFINMAKSFKKINRAPELRTNLTNTIIEWKYNIANTKK